MAGLPSHIFVVRHGNRLDAADKKWHLTSPTPYDPPLTYGGFLQARRVGLQIGSYLENAKADYEASSNKDTPDPQRAQRTHKKRKRFQVVIHSSPFLRCVQTSIGISSGLAQSSADSPLSPADLVVSAPPPAGKPVGFRSAILRLDSSLGEWLSPEYFENITPPPGSQFMLSSAKADLLKRDDYSRYTHFDEAPTPTTQTGSLWSGSPTAGGLDRKGSPASSEGPFGSRLPGSPGENKGYRAPRPTYAVSGSDKIPDGFVAHARDACLSIDYQWDSMRPPLEFGDGGQLGEEWTTMHRRFRNALKRMLNWYATTENSTSNTTTAANTLANVARNGESATVECEEGKGEEEQEVIETVVVIVSHGAGCNALMGAITHQPVLMDVPTASITMAVRKTDLDYAQLAALPAATDSLVPVDQMYDIRLSASTEHLHANTGTPVSTRSTSVPSSCNSALQGSRGRTSTVGAGALPSLGPFTYTDSLMSTASRSTSVSGALEPSSLRRDSAPRSMPRAMASIHMASIASNGSTGGGLPPPPTSSPSPSLGLWTPTPSSLRLMDDGNGTDGKDDLSSSMPTFDQKRFHSKERSSEAVDPLMQPLPRRSSSRKVYIGPKLAAPIRLKTDWDSRQGVPAEEVAIAQLGDGLDGLWTQARPPGPDDAEKMRDMTTSKRRWTVNER